MNHPSALLRVRSIFLMLAGLQVLVAFLFFINRGAIAEMVRHGPTCAAARNAQNMQNCVDGTIVGSIGVHAVLMLLLIGISRTVLRPAPWRRVAASVVLVLFIVSSYFVLSPSHVAQVFPTSIYPYVVVEQIGTLVLELLALWLLWSSAPIKHFFSGQRSTFRNVVGE